LDASFDGIFVADERLYLDGWILTDFLAWVKLQMRPDVTSAAFVRKLEGYFYGNNIKDVLLAISHVVLGIENQVNGERQHFAAKVRNSNPQGFSELAISCALERIARTGR
jgi:hypothetical protein